MGFRVSTRGQEVRVIRGIVGGGPVGHGDGIDIRQANEPSNLRTRRKSSRAARGLWKSLAPVIVFFAIKCPVSEAGCRRGTNLEFRIQWNIRASSLRTDRALEEFG